MTRLLQRLKKLEARGPDSDEIVLIITGVPRHDKVGELVVAIMQHGWVTKNACEIDDQFRARAQRRRLCAH